MTQEHSPWRRIGSVVFAGMLAAVAFAQQGSISLERGIPGDPRHETAPTPFDGFAPGDGQAHDVRAKLTSQRETSMEIQEYDPESSGLLWHNPERVESTTEHTFTGSVTVDLSDTNPVYSWITKFYGRPAGTGGGGGSPSDWSFPARLDAISLVLRVDSNNDGNLDETDDAIRNDEDKPGKIIACNTGMTINDKPGFADFEATSVAFAEMQVLLHTVTGVIDWENATIKFVYSGSENPEDLENLGDLRLWKKSGDRTDPSVAVNYVPPDVALPAEAIFGQGGSSMVTLYIEAIHPGPFSINAVFKPTSDPNEITDEVRVTAMDIAIASQSTSNFSPHLYEDAEFGITITPNPATLGPTVNYWTVECHVIQKLTNGGTRLVQKLNMEPEQSGYASFTDMFQQKTIPWDGMLNILGGEQWPNSAEGRDEFQHGVRENFHRLLPPMAYQEPVPPPLYTVQARIMAHIGGQYVLFATAEHDVAVPQVVHLILDETTEDVLLEPIYEEGVLVVQKFTEAQVAGLLNAISAIAEDYYGVGPGVNVRFVTTASGLRGKHSTVTVTGVRSPTGGWGGADGCDFGNLIIDDTARVYVPEPRFEFGKRYIESTSNPPVADPIDFPFTQLEQVMTSGWVTAHEFGHLLGLVAENDVLDGSSGSHNRSPYELRRIMNPANDTLEARICRNGAWNFRERNYEYLKFILPNK